MSLPDELESRYAALMKATERIGITPRSGSTEIGVFIWQLREMEIFTYDLVFQFSRHNNMRDLYRKLLAFRHGGKDLACLREELQQYRIEHEAIRSWLLDIVSRLKRNETYLNENLDFESCKGFLFKSYGLALQRSMIFTLDPDTGRCFASDRRLIEHLDFVQYLGRNRDGLVRGELSGDVNDESTPIYLGVWSATSRADLQQKLRMIQRGARCLLSMGIKGEKKIAFYNTTFNSCESELDTLKVTSLAEFTAATEEELDRLLVSSDDELRGLALSCFQDG